MFELRTGCAEAEFFAYNHISLHVVRSLCEQYASYKRTPALWFENRDPSETGHVPRAAVCIATVIMLNLPTMAARDTQTLGFDSGYSPQVFD
jgi:hypothetical protein